jgi:hypothetical protein
MAIRSTHRQVNSGLIKMYKEEVLHKFPVIQHFLFGALLHMEPQAAPGTMHAGIGMTTHPATWKQGPL